MKFPKISCRCHEFKIRVDSSDRVRTLPGEMEMERFWLLIVLVVCSPFAEAQKLHVVLIGDTNDPRIGADTDLDSMASVLEDGLPASRLRIQRMTGSEVTPDQIESRLSALRIEPNDSVLVYYSGHGGYSTTDGHYLSLTLGGNLYRDKVVRAITRPYTPRFWGLITDCCASVSEDSVTYTVQTGPPSTTLLTHLFFDTPGRIDFTSCRPEQVSYGSPLRGGWFTRCFCQVLSENKSRRLRWDDVFKRARSRTTELSETALAGFPSSTLHSYRGVSQQVQVPYSFREMYGQDVNGLRFGVTSTGRVVRSIRSGSAASRSGLRPGMRIDYVNGIDVDTDKEIATAINFSRRTASVRVRDTNGQSRTINVQLSY